MPLNTKARILLQRQVEMMIQASGKAGSSGRWPMPVLKTTHEATIHSEPWVAQALFDGLSSLHRAGLTNRNIGELFPYPSTLARLSMIFRSRSIWKLSPAHQVAAYNDLADIVASKYARLPFCQGGQNILLETAEEKSLRLKIHRQGLKIPRELMAQLDGRLWLYSEMLYSRWHNLAHEFHGVYRNGPKLLIKEWHDLAGPGWMAFASFPYRRVTCYEFFKNNAVSIDIHNRLKTANPFVGTVTSAYVAVNGRFVGPKKVYLIIKTLDRYLIRGSKFLATRKTDQLKTMNAIMEFYTLKPIADALNKDWHPTPEVAKSIQIKVLPVKTRQMLERLTYYYTRNTRRNLKVQYDPSVVFK